MQSSDSANLFNNGACSRPPQLLRRDAIALNLDILTFPCRAERPQLARSNWLSALFHADLILINAETKSAPGANLRALP
jgi:hypothetical protein